jgi:hypothetical protein
LPWTPVQRRAAIVSKPCSKDLGADRNYRR